MRKIHKILIPSLLAVSLGLTFVGINASKEMVKTEAGTINGGELYIRVTDKNQLHVGDTVLMASSYYEMICSGHGGNPIYCTAIEDNGFNNDSTKIYLAPSNYIARLLVGNGASGCPNTFSFRNMTNDGDKWYPAYNDYLAYGHWDYNEHGHSLQTYGDIHFKSALETIATS